MTRAALAAAVLALVFSACALEGEIPQDRSKQGPVTAADTVFYQDASWSPDGEYLLLSVFHRDRYHLELAALHDSTYRRLTFGETSDYWGSWAPDSRRFVFKAKTDGHSRIDLSDIEGRIRATITPDTIEATTPAWSPDGNTIAFSMKVDSIWQIALMSPDGKNIRVIGAGMGDEYNPRWSADSKWLVYYGRFNDTDWVYTIQADGSDRTKLVPGVFPDISPDGSKIAFDRDHDVYVMNRNGSNVILFIEDGFAARWAPDQGAMAFVRGRWPQSEVWIVRHDTVSLSGGRIIHKLFRGLGERTPLGQLRPQGH